jgi:hypothetical protein
MDDVSARTGFAEIASIAGPGDHPLDVAIDFGRHHGVGPGSGFLIYGYGPDIVQPNTGEPFGPMDLVRERGEVVPVEETLATIRSIERNDLRLAKLGARQMGARQMCALADPLTNDETPPALLPFDGVRVGDVARPL